MGYLAGRNLTSSLWTRELSYKLLRQVLQYNGDYFSFFLSPFDPTSCYFASLAFKSHFRMLIRYVNDITYVKFKIIWSCIITGDGVGSTQCILGPPFSLLVLLRCIDGKDDDDDMLRFEYIFVWRQICYEKSSRRPWYFYFLTVVQQILKTILIFENGEQLQWGIFDLSWLATES